MYKPRILVFASGSATGGGSGFQEMVEQSRTNPPILDAEIVAVVSNHPNGGVRKKAEHLGVPFEFWDGPFDVRGYLRQRAIWNSDFVMLSGWLKKVKGLDPDTTVNIHPGLVRDGFAGEGMYGHHVHEAVMEAYHEGRVKQSGVTMHFVDAEYDHGPIFFSKPVLIREDDDSESLAKRVNEVERTWQSYMLNAVVHGRIRLVDGIVIYQ